MERTIQVGKRGVLTLPADLREKYGLRSGDVLQLVDLGGVFLLTPMAPVVPDLAREIERLRRELSLSIEDLLAALRREREAYYREHYERENAR